MRVRAEYSFMVSLLGATDGNSARDPALLLALGKLCMRQGLWGKAQSYIEASLALEPTHDGHMTLAALMEQIGKPQEAVAHFRKSAQLAG